MTDCGPCTHEKKFLYIQSERGYFIIHPNGSIQRTDMVWPPSDQWKLVGLRKHRKHDVYLEDITPEFVATMGNNWHVLDLDHGTFREWGDKILSISIYDTLAQTPHYANGGRYNLERQEQKQFLEECRRQRGPLGV